MAITAPCHNKLKPVQYVEAPLRIPPLFRVITDNLTDRSQLPLVHSPFPQFTLYAYPNNSYERIFYKTQDFSQGARLSLSKRKSTRSMKGKPVGCAPLVQKRHGGNSSQFIGE
jgi:hypothetical protein